MVILSGLLTKGYGSVNDVSDLAGTRLGDYALLYKLASGGMAHIYIGEDERLGRKAAVKILTPDMAGDDELLTERFEREARAIAQLEHDNIIPIYQFGEANDLYFLAMRYIEGNDLADEMKLYKDEGKLMEPERVLRILEQVAQALDYAHGHGIVHRDVKPSNILLGDNDKAYLSDFGLVLWQSVDQTLGTAFGTPRYISPEQATDSQSAVPQSDVYSMAVIVYELLTGKVLFTGATPMEVALSHITERPTPPRAHNPEIPAAAQNEILRALQKDTSKRHPTSMDFIRMLQRAYGLLDVPKPEETTSEPELDGGTIPLAPTEIKQAVQSIQNQQAADSSWDAPDEDDVATISDPDRAGMSDVIPSPKPKAASQTETKQESGVPLRIIAVVAVVLLIVVAGLIFPNMVAVAPDDGSTQDVAIADPDSTATPESAAADEGDEAPAVVPSGDAVPVTIRYNEDFFALINDNPVVSFNLSDLSIEGGEGEVFDDFANTLAPAECFIVQLSGTQTSDIPEDWGCEVARSSTLGGSAYWVANAVDDTTFRFLKAGTEVGSCETVGRAVSRLEQTSCTVEWDVFEN